MRRRWRYRVGPRLRLTGLSLPAAQHHIHACETHTLAVPALPASDCGDGGHDLRDHPAAADSLVSGDASTYPSQEQRLARRTLTPSRVELSRSAADQAQADAGNGRTGVERQLSGRVKIDDAYLGGERAGMPGRVSPNKVPLSSLSRPRMIANRIRWCFDARRLRTPLSVTGRYVVGGRDPEPCPTAFMAFRALRDEVASHQAIVTGLGRTWVEHPLFNG